MRIISNIADKKLVLFSAMEYGECGIIRSAPCDHYVGYVVMRCKTNVVVLGSINNPSQKFDYWDNLNNIDTVFVEIVKCHLVIDGVI